MASSRSEYNSDAQWLENEIAELNTFSELARQRALQAAGDERHQQLTDIAEKLRLRAERLASILQMLKAAKPQH
jgi:pyruvate-formate lyase